MPKVSSAARKSDRANPEPVAVAAPALPPDIAVTEPPQTYEAAKKFLASRINYERMSPTRLPREAFGLDRTRALLEALGNPQRDVRCVHIAGSKGKGSVAEMTAACLAACGNATGLFTSPHLMDLRERIRINDEPISPHAFTGALARCAVAEAKVRPAHGDATYFELLTAAALVYFAEKAVDIAVMEVGLGGRLDSTNVIDPEVTAVTAIQLEHVQVLGDTLEKIAREKAGIFKPGVTALTIPQTPGVMAVFREVAQQVGAPLEVVGEDIEFSYRVAATHDRSPHVRVCITTPRSAYEHLPVPLIGEHQAHNCGLALAIVDKLRDRGFDAPEKSVAAGLAKTNTQGRMEMVCHSPRIVIDGAHTADSVHALMRSIGQHVKYDSMVVIFGCAEDKDAKGMLAKLATGADKIIFTKAAGNPRAMDPRELARRFAEVSHKMTQVTRSLPDALALAEKAVGRDDLICVTGSFYVAGEAKRILLERRGGAVPGRA
ncbi:MAG: bifunctional folylpolyglutamate synthase/dihydrofolate synthase [Phycisphaerales bacterium]